MSVPLRAENFVDTLSVAVSFDDLYGVIDTQVQRLGFEKFTYHVVRPPEGPRKRFYLSSYPSEWVDHYIEQGYVNVDPIAPLAATTILPFSWRELRNSPHANPKWEQFFNESSDFGLGNGATIPVHGPGNCLATFNLVAHPSTSDFDALWAANKYDLHLMAMYSHEAIVNHVLFSQGEKFVLLAPRERECLLWTSRGKTVWEISEILSLSDETVATYLKTASRKLGVYSKTHAVVKAILFGIIVP